MVLPTRIEFSAYDLLDYFPPETTAKGCLLIMEDYYFDDPEAVEIVTTAVNLAIENEEFDMNGFRIETSTFKCETLHGGSSEDEPIITIYNITWKEKEE